MAGDLYLVCRSRWQWSHKMTATMKTMEFKKVDDLFADQLMVGDYIKINDEIVEIISIDSMHYGYSVAYQNDFGEKDFIELPEESVLELFVYK